MATISKFEDIVAWQEAQNLTIAIYKQLNLCRDFGYRDQIQRAAVSMMNNITEGFDRQGDKEFKHFLCIANRSCSEVRSMLTISDSLGYLSVESAARLIEQTNAISRTLSAFIRKLD